MDKKFYKNCIQHEVYRNKNLNIVSKLLYKYFAAATNCVYMIRKMIYLYDKGRINKFRAFIIRKRLITKYGVHVYPTIKIGLGLYIPHPSSIIITGHCAIGDNFTILQNCTVGIKHIENEEGPAPNIGNNVKMCASSMIIGGIVVADNVTIGANSMLLNDAVAPGMYLGSPAKLHQVK